MTATTKHAADARPAPRTLKQRLTRIVEDGLCVGCGLCASLAKDGAVTMKTSPLGYLRPYVTGEIGDDLVDTVYGVCPGLRQDTLPSHLLAADTVVDPVWGPYRAM